MNARTDAANLKFRMDSLRENNTLAAERDAAIIQRDQARREVMSLQTQLRLMTNDRDEARALGRIA